MGQGSWTGILTELFDSPIACQDPNTDWASLSSVSYYLHHTTTCCCLTLREIKAYGGNFIPQATGATPWEPHL